MSRPRTYRHHMRCPHCGSNWVVKDGRPRGKQTYRMPTCQRAREQWDSDNMADVEQISNGEPFNAVHGVKDDIEGELSGILRDIRDEARDLAQTLMWHALHQR